MSAPRGMAAFLVICCGQMVSLFGTGVTGFALGVWAYQRTGSVTQYSIILLFNVLPIVLLSPVAGALVDRLDRRRVMIASDCAAGLAVLTLAALFFSVRLAIWHIYVLLSIASAAQAFRWPALAASMTSLVPGPQIGRASGLMQMSGATAQVLAPLAAGALWLPLGVAGLLALDFATFLLAVLTVLAVHIPRAETASAASTRESLLRPLGYGWIYLRRHAGLLALLALFAGSNFTMGLLTVLITPLVLSFASTRVLGTVLSVASGGLLAGSSFMVAWGGPRRRLAGIGVAMAVQSLVLLLGGWHPNAPRLAASAFVFLFGYAVINTCSQALWQSKVAPDIQGRVFALRQMIALSALPLSRLVAGPLADKVFEPLLAPGGRLAGTLGRVLGVGSGRGIGLLIILLGLFNLLVLALAWSYPRLRLLEGEMPDLTLPRQTAPV
jgi:MFS transporter, DHA3 family, macrolide efflux protein